MGGTPSPPVRVIKMDLQLSALWQYLVMLGNTTESYSQMKVERIDDNTVLRVSAKKSLSIALQNIYRRYECYPYDLHVGKRTVTHWVVPIEP